MTIGVPSEIKAQENRISMIPSYVSDLVKRGHRVVVQSGAGEGSAYANDQYLAAGGDLVPDAKSVFQEAELIEADAGFSWVVCQGWHRVGWSSSEVAPLA